jgi:hypothetical protein
MRTSLSPFQSRGVIYHHGQDEVNSSWPSRRLYMFQRYQLPVVRKHSSCATSILARIQSRYLHIAWSIGTKVSQHLIKMEALIYKHSATKPCVRCLYAHTRRIALSFHCDYASCIQVERGIAPPLSSDAGSRLQRSGTLSKESTGRASWPQKQECNTVIT